MAFVSYNVHVAVLIAVFYMFYRLLLSRDSLHWLNRVVLVGTALASFVLPLCVITTHRTELIAAAPAVPATVAATVAQAAAPQKPWWQAGVPVVYWAGVAITLLYTIVSISKVCILISRCERHRQGDGTVIAVAPGEVSPFSWMRFIVVSRSDYAHPDRAILLHEREHVRRHHSVDVVLVDMLSSLQWFNPAMWMLRADLRAIHEYEADAAVLSAGMDARQYQYLLVRKAVAATGYSVANGINHSTLKQRISMMNSHNHNKYSWAKALYVLPVVAVSLMVSARTVTDYKVMPKSQTQHSELAAPTASPVTASTTNSPDAGDQAQGLLEASVPADSATLSKALVTVDGKVIPYSALGDINPNDIESVTVLKDKAALEKYGAKTAVIVVKTKGHASAASGGADMVFDVVEDMPAFTGGKSALMQYLAQNVRYPKVAMEWGVQGRVIVSFIVNDDGAVTNVAVAKNLASAKSAADVDVVSYASQNSDDADAEARKKGEAEGKAALEAEAVRVVSSMPAWQPGRQQGKAVKTRYNIPLTFRLE